MVITTFKTTTIPNLMVTHMMDMVDMGVLTCLQLLCYSPRVRTLHLTRMHLNLTWAHRTCRANGTL
jgi:hypothetical protein